MAKQLNSKSEQVVAIQKDHVAEIQGLADMTLIGQVVRIQDFNYITLYVINAAKIAIFHSSQQVINQFIVEAVINQMDLKNQAEGQTVLTGEDLIAEMIQETGSNLDQQRQVLLLKT
jgi:hypothetical protein